MTQNPLRKNGMVIGKKTSWMSIPCITAWAVWLFFPCTIPEVDREDDAELAHAFFILLESYFLISLYPYKAIFLNSYRIIRITQ